jgi:hypothetical protein
MPPHAVSQSPGTAQTQLVWSSFAPETAGRQTPPFGWHREQSQGGRRRDDLYGRAVGDGIMLQSMFWVIWYPLAFWLISATTTVVGLPLALKPRRERTTWVSPDRGLR